MRSASVATTKEETDLISFANEIPHASVAPKIVSDDNYDKLKESIMKLSTTVNNQPQQNLQLIPYQKHQANLTPEGLNSLYSMSQNINQFYSQNKYFHQPSTSQAPYPAIGFSHFVQQPNYGFNNYYQSSNSSQTYWSPQSSALSINIPPQPTTTKTIATPTQLVEPKVMTALSVNQTPSTSTERPVVRSTVNQAVFSSDNLINFDVDDSNYDVNILETFDPLVSSNRSSSEDADNAYYVDQDPFDYIYSGGTQYSDPLYEAVVRSDHSLSSPKSQTPQDISEYYALSGNNDEINPPPLPPRNLNIPDESSYDTNGSVIQFSKKLYENVTHHKRFDRDLIAFYTMVKELRSKYIYDHDESNVGHIIASELDSNYIKVASIKLLVYPSLECFQGRYTEPHSDRSQENYQKLEGYANPIVFTCDINANIMLVISHVLVELEGKISGNAEDFALKTIGSQEWIVPTSSLSHLEYIQLNITLERDIQLGLFPKNNSYMKVLARTSQDDVRDADIKLENILPKEVVSSISYDTLMILLETVEMEIDKLESTAADNLSLHPSGVIQAVKAICALLGCIDTPELFMAINNLKEACSNHSQSFHARVSKTSGHTYVILMRLFFRHRHCIQSHQPSTLFPSKEITLESRCDLATQAKISNIIVVKSETRCNIYSRCTLKLFMSTFQSMDRNGILVRSNEDESLLTADLNF